jgi:hypothetical protein
LFSANCTADEADGFNCEQSLSDVGRSDWLRVDVQRDPIKNGKKNHVLVLIIWKRWNADESVKMTMKMIDAGSEGS